MNVHISAWLVTVVGVQTARTVRSRDFIMTAEAQDTGIRNVLLTGKMSEPFPWLEPKSSDFASDLFINPSSKKAEETPCDPSLRVCRLQEAAPEIAQPGSRGGGEPRASAHSAPTAALRVLDPSLHTVRELLQPHSSLINVAEKMSKGRNRGKTTSGASFPSKSNF